MNTTHSVADRFRILFCIVRYAGVLRLAPSLKKKSNWVRAISLTGALIGMAALSSCSFSTTIPWGFDACEDLDAIEPTPVDDAPDPSVVFEEIGSIKVMWGATQATSPADRVLRVEQSVELPPYANQATVFLNGWQAAYADPDHFIHHVAAVLGRITVTPGQKISWNAFGELADSSEGKKAFRWTYRYMIIAWNDASVRAMIDHNDAEHFCRTGEPHGGDNFFEGKNLNTPESTTALSSFASFLRNPGFASGRQVAVLPRGFVFNWSQADDHKLLQLAYNLESVAPFVRSQEYHKATKLLNPLANAAAELANGEFESWKTSAILKDNSRRRDYDFAEFVSGMGGADVEIIQPEFVILPREDVDTSFPGGGTYGGLKSADVVIENLPYLCAVPILTGWEIGYANPGEGDQAVKELGIWIERIEYTRLPGSPTGTLRYTVKSVLRDKDNFPDNFFRHKVTILGLKPTGVVVRPEGLLRTDGGQQ